MFRIARMMPLRQWLWFAVGVVFVLFQVWMDLTVPDYMETITVLVKTPGSSMAEILANGWMMLLCAALSVAGAVIGSYFCVRFAAYCSMDLRTRIFERVESYNMEEIDTFSRASLITRSTNDVIQVQNFMARGLQNFVRAAFMIVIAIAKLSGRYWQWTALTGAAVGIMVCVLIFLVRFAHPRLRLRQHYTDELSRILRENLTGIRVIRAYNAEDYQQERFEQANEATVRNELNAHRAMGLMRPTVKFMNNALMAGIYCIGAFLIASANAGDQIAIFSSMVVYTSYAAILIQAFMDLNGAFNMYPRGAVAAERILKVLDQPPSVKDGPGADSVSAEESIPGSDTTSFASSGQADTASPGEGVSLRMQDPEQEGAGAGPDGREVSSSIADSYGQEEGCVRAKPGRPEQESAGAGAAGIDLSEKRKEVRLPAGGKRGTLEFRHVSFHYPGAGEVLHDVSFRAEAGQTLAIIGATGSGKTTIANLIPRLYDASSGQILLDGIDIRMYTQGELRNRIGYAAQSAFLFSGTIRSNVMYGDNGRPAGDDASVREALRIAQALEFTDRLEDGPDAPIRRGGTNVSGGQRQRISIARAVYRRPEIYVFDDTFSALDYSTDRKLRQELKEASEAVTTILIAQRIGTIRDADRILVLEDGRICAEGTHEYLMANCGIYREIAMTQMQEGA